MTRSEFVESCRARTEEQLQELAVQMRKRAGSRIPPQVALQFRSLDGVTEAEELQVPTAWGKTHVYMVRKKERPAGKLPLLVNVHGGGWCMDHTERDIFFSRRMALAAGCLVADVDYVLAPEHPYPAAIEEIEALLDALPDLAQRYGGDIRRVILCGQSAGGNLVGAVTQRGRYTDRLTILAQILCYLPADNYNDHFHGGELDERGQITEYYGFFYNRNFEERKNHDVSLVMASLEEVRHVPATDIVTAGLDNLLPEGRQYFELLERAGVPATYRCFEHSRHGFLVNLCDEWKVGEDYITGRILAHLGNT